MSLGRLRRLRIRRRDDRGAVAVIVAVSMLMLTVTAALVLDFGVVRLDRQQNKLAADAAVAAGLQAADKGTGDFYNATAVCAAYAFLKANREQLSGLPAGVCASPSTTQICVAGDPTTDFTYNATTTSGNKTFEVWIKSRYRVAETTGGGSFPDESSMTSLSADTGDGTKQGCDQLAVIIRQKTRPGLGQLISSGDLVSRTRSVGRVSDGPPESPYALLILERHDCDALANSSGGAGGRIDVSGFDTHPANIHVDSDGTGAQCMSKPIIEGKNPGTCPDPGLARRIHLRRRGGPRGPRRRRSRPDHRGGHLQHQRRDPQDLRRPLPRHQPDAPRPGDPEGPRQGLPARRHQRGQRRRSGFHGGGRGHGTGRLHDFRLHRDRHHRGGQGVREVCELQQGRRLPQRHGRDLHRSGRLGQAVDACGDPGLHRRRNLPCRRPGRNEVRGARQQRRVLPDHLLGNRGAGTAVHQERLAEDCRRIILPGMQHHRHHDGRGRRRVSPMRRAPTS